MTRGITAKKLLKFISLTLLFVIILFYGLWRGRDLLFGINLEIYGIQNNETATSSVIELSGNAYHAISITVDGRIVSIEQDGQWHDTIALLDGYNIVSISAKDKFDRTITKVFTVNYNAPPDAKPPLVPSTDDTQTTTSTDSTIGTSTVTSEQTTQAQ